MVSNYLAANTDTNSQLYMIFKLSGKSYAVLAEKILEIVQLPVLDVPEKLPNYVAGVFNLRGNIISVIDLRIILGKEPTNYTTENQVLIVNFRGQFIGIIVESVKNVIQFNTNEIGSIPYEGDKSFIAGLNNWEEEIISFIDIEKVSAFLDSEEIKTIEKINYEKLFPVDEISKHKFKKRALNLQKELKVEINRNDYNEDKFVSFSVNDELYCICLKFVKEFTKLKHINITPVPCVPSFISGIVNLRGEFITIIDLKCFFGISNTEITEKTKIIVVKNPNLQIGLLVDDVFDLMSIPNEKLNNENSAKYEKNKYTIAEVILEENTVLSILNLEKLFSDDRIYIEDAV